MKHIHFDVESDGFYGAYWACKDGSDCAVIAMLGDDPEDYMARSAVKWLLRLGGSQPCLILPAPVTWLLKSLHILQNGYV